MKKLLALLLALTLLCPLCTAAAPTELSAASAILMDAESGRVLYEKDARSRRLIASTTKLMTALVAAESTPRLDTVITVEPEHYAEGSSMYLKAGEELTLEELLYGLLLQSGNDAALAIADGCAGDTQTFVDWMNDWAQDLGMTDTHFMNPNGLDHEEHYSTAYDMALLARAVLKSEPLREIVATKTTQVAGRSLTNHNKLLWDYEGCDGMKTGYTIAAGRTLVSSATRDGQTLICVTLNAPNDWEDHRKLLDYGFACWRLHPLARREKTFRTIPVTGSLIPSVSVVTARDVSYPLASDERVLAEIMLPRSVKAPVWAGTIAGKLTFTVNGQPAGETYLLYGEDVPANLPKVTFYDRIRELFSGTSSAACLAALVL